MPNKHYVCICSDTELVIFAIVSTEEAAVAAHKKQAEESDLYTIAECLEEREHHTLVVTDEETLWWRDNDGLPKEPLHTPSKLIELIVK